MKSATTIDSERGECPAEAPEGRVPGIHIPGWMLPVELYWLAEQGRRYNSVANIGVWRGRSAYALASSCPGTVYCIDHLDDALRVDFVEYMEPFLSSGKVVLVESESEDASRSVPDCEMVFIDAVHDYESVCSDIQTWLPKCRHVLCGHDYDVPAVKQAVDEVFGDCVRKGFGSIWYVEVCRGCGYVS